MFDPAAPRYCPADRGGIAGHVDHMLQTIEQTVAGYEPFGCVKLLAFPEFAHASPRLIPARVKKRWSHRSTSPPCAMPARPAGGTECWRTFGPWPTRCIATSVRPSRRPG